MKRDNPLWGCRRISDELKKLGIELHHTTVNKIIQTFRKNGQAAGWYLEEVSKSTLEFIINYPARSSGPFSFVFGKAGSKYYQGVC